MMAAQIYKTKPFFYQNRAESVVYTASNFAHPFINYPSDKRRVLTRWCSRLNDSGLSGSDLVVEYLHAKYIKNLSVSTIQQAGRIILYFLRFLSRDGTTVYTMTRQNISAYVEYEQDRGLKMQSVANHLRALYTFIVFLVEQGVLTQEIMQRKIRIKLPDPLPRSIPAEDVQLLFEAIITIRDRAMLLLLLRTGMRIGELLMVKTTDISFTERKILIYLGEKNFQGRAVYFSEDAEKALKQWLKSRNKDSEYLFPSPRKSSRSSISYVAAWGVMRRGLERAGLSGKGYSLHSLRHTFATDMLNAGMRLEVLQHILGHHEIDMTMRYARISSQTRENEYFKAMECIEQGEYHGSYRINNKLQKVLEEKKLLRSYSKKLS
ncbi:MAG: tyrosine-type recombinase/integrase [Desulfobulbaceae bacterium]|nr:tyrosine-type recombinase/integrase [Desulfobulbaceae bacterium]